MINKEAKVTKKYPLVHLSAADLVFKYGVQTCLESMSKMCKIKRRTYRTPEYRSDVREELEELLRTYDARLPAQPDGAGIELHWESPTVVEQNGEMVMVRWQDRDDQMVEELVTTREAKRAR